MPGTIAHGGTLAVLLLLSCFLWSGCSNSRVGPNIGPLQSGGAVTVHNSRYYARSPLTASVPSYGHMVVIPGKYDYFQMYLPIPDVEGVEVASGTMQFDQNHLATIVGEATVSDYFSVSGNRNSQQSSRCSVEYVVLSAVAGEVVNVINNSPAILNWMRARRAPRVVIENVVLLKHESAERRKLGRGLKLRVLPADDKNGGELAITSDGEDSNEHLLGRPVIWAYKMHQVIFSSDRSRVDALQPDPPDS